MKSVEKNVTAQWCQSYGSSQTDLERFQMKSVEKNATAQWCQSYSSSLTLRQIYTDLKWNLRKQMLQLSDVSPTAHFKWLKGATYVVLQIHCAGV